MTADTLITTPHLDAPDDFYEALIGGHADLSTAQSHAMNARLVLLLSNHIGSLRVLQQAIDAARASVRPDEADLTAVPAIPATEVTR